MTAVADDTTMAPGRGSGSPASSAILEASGLVRTFGGVHAVDRMSLSLGAGEILGLIGPNGAGKTTMFNMLAGSLRPDGGTIRIDGVEVGRQKAHERVARGLARTFQIPRPFPLMSVLENVMTAATGHPGEGVIANLIGPRGVARREREEAKRARDILAFLSLDALADQPARVLSGGQRKLLELARVLMVKPRVVLLDEPAAGVNPALLDFIVERIGDINREGVSVLLIEHNMELVKTLCRRVVVMAQGSMLAEGEPDDVMRDAAVVEAFLGGTAT